MKLINKVTSGFDRAIVGFGVLGIILMVLTLVVFLRYFFRRAAAWSLEIIEFCLLFLAFLGATWLLKEEQHIKMDIVLERLRPKARLWLNVITSLMSAISCLIITWYGATACWGLYKSGQYFATYLEPPKYIIIAIVPFGCLLLSIQLLRRAYGFFRGIAKEKEELLIE